jgi:hypothetical protein
MVGYQQWGREDGASLSAPAETTLQLQKARIHKASDRGAGVHLQRGEPTQRGGATRSLRSWTQGKKMPLQSVSGSLKRKPLHHDELIAPLYGEPDLPQRLLLTLALRPIVGRSEEFGRTSTASTTRAFT